MKKFTKKQKKVLDSAFDDVKVAERRYYKAIRRIEVKLEQALGVVVEVFHVDGCAVGFGDYGREYELYQEGL